MASWPRDQETKVGCDSSSLSRSPYLCPSHRCPRTWAHLAPSPSVQSPGSPQLEMVSSQRGYGPSPATGTGSTASSQRLCFISCWDQRPMDALLYHFTKKVAPPTPSLPRPGPKPTDQMPRIRIVKSTKGPEHA